ncbi:hypothetical protein [Anaerophilus nitritogenes]|uniref:hypothetical protein n=1 Tax=Anaerophilus nitritogenes TaxID=2498136 RepID=UPI00101C4B91|nr:hypothetical protein [Anaerophilus nitritogenes]
MDYKEGEKILALMNDKDWVETIDQLKNLECNNEKYDYRVIYRQGQQKKNRSFTFHKVNHEEGTETFTFILFDSDWETGDLTEEINDRIVLRRSEIINLEVKEKFDWSKIPPCVSKVDF